ncbi:hypothetical protein Scep_026329 [Stephania cephalantha]|uniref:RING-type domain-containing protein n=1 Tax=Stephania cephalantha TaxID=152367 RepID=A0AAP0HT80_9MAGN
MLDEAIEYLKQLQLQVQRNSPPTEVILFHIKKKGLHVPYWVFILGVLIFVGVGVCLACYFSRRRPPNQLTNNIELQIIQVENSPRVLGPVENLSVVTFGDTEGNLLYDHRDCPICLEDFYPQDRLMVFPSCRHAIHDICAASFLTTSNSCPYCRHAIRPGV